LRPREAGSRLRGYRGNAALVNEGDISGARTPNLRIANLSPADVDSYSCNVSLGARQLRSGDFFLAIRRKPVMNAFAPGTWIVGGDVSGTLTAINDATSFSVTGLPSGVICNPRTGEITGKPRVAGSYPIVIRASNAAGVSIAIGTTITVLPLPDHGRRALQRTGGP